MKTYMDYFCSILLLSSFILVGCAQRVFVVGGSDNHGNFLATAEVYDPSTGTFIPSRATMSSGRLTSTATSLGNNTTVLVAGGQGPTSLQTAELYQSIGDSFTLTKGGLNHVRVAHTATYLDPAVVDALGGQVLIAGGDEFSVAGTAETYDPTSNAFIETGNMTSPRIQHTAVLISHCGCAADGSVLIVGGYDNHSNVLSSAELYNPVTKTFTATGKMHSPRFRHTATLLDNGMVLITGGASKLSSENNINPALNTAELYNPKTGTFTLTKTPMTAYREAHAASLLQDGTVLLTGGQDNHFLIENSAEIFNPTTGTFSSTSPEGCAGIPAPAGCMSSGRDFHLSQTLPDGRVLIAGGINSAFTTIATAELYNPTTHTFTPTGSMSIPRSGAAASIILSGL